MTDQFSVSGRVFCAKRAGVGGLCVRLVDKNAGPDVPLASTEILPDGSYALEYAITQLREEGKAAPDIQARVFSGDTFLGASEIRYSAGRVETLDVDLPDTAAAALPAEYDTLTAAIEGLCKGRLCDLQETDDRSDITYLANKCGWDARAVAMAALADQFSQHRARGAKRAGAAALQPAFYYALFRAGLPANPDTLYQADAQTVEQVWQRAIEEGVIPRALENELPRAVQTFRSLSAARILDVPAATGTSTPREMLKLALGDAKRQRQFAELYTELRGDPTAFWDAVGQSFGEETAKRLQLDGQLGYLTLNNAPLIGRLHDTEADSHLSSTVDLAQRGYYRAEKWSQLVDGAVPEQIPGESSEEKRANYAELLAAQVRLSFPTAVVAEMVRSGDVPLPAAADVREGVHAFLAGNQGEFEIGMHPIERYLAGNDLGDQVTEPVKQEIKRLQRVYQITPTDAAMAGLLRNKLDRPTRSSATMRRTSSEVSRMSWAARTMPG